MNTIVLHGRALARPLPSAFALMTLLCLAGPALASCGAASCTLMTDRFTQGTAEHIGWSADLRLEAVTQDRLRSGTSNIDASQVTGEEVIERHTKNLNIVTTLGWSHAYSQALGVVLQADVRQRGRDSGALAEPELSGGSAVDISPGITFGVGSASTLYAYLQLPVYQKVNGIQLVPRSALAVGWTADF